MLDLNSLYNVCNTDAYVVARTSQVVELRENAAFVAEDNHDYFVVKGAEHEFFAFITAELLNCDFTDIIRVNLFYTLDEARQSVIDQMIIDSDGSDTK